MKKSPLKSKSKMNMKKDKNDIINEVIDYLANQITWTSSNALSSEQVVMNKNIQDLVKRIRIYFGIEIEE